MPDESVAPSDSDLYSRTRFDPPDPRERLQRLGVRALSSTDLLALVIGSPTAAQGLVRRHGVAGLAELPLDSWRRHPGLGKARSARLCAVFELGRRAYSTAAEAARPRLTRPADAFKEVRHIGGLKKEHLVGLYLDAQNGLLHAETISVGSLNTTRTHPREILEPVLRHLALGFILAHNHPSGAAEPSADDVEFTRGVARAAALMDVGFYDHLVVTRRGWVSLRERGLM